MDFTLREYFIYSIAPFWCFIFFDLFEFDCFETILSHSMYTCDLEFSLSPIYAHILFAYRTHAIIMTTSFNDKIVLLCVDSFFNQTFSFYWFKKDIQICVHMLTRFLIQFTHALTWGIEAKSKTQNCMHYNISHLIASIKSYLLSIEKKCVLCIRIRPNHSIFFCLTHFCGTFYDSIKIERWKLGKNFDSIWIMYIFSSKDSEHLCMHAQRVIFFSV